MNKEAAVLEARMALERYKDICIEEYKTIFISDDGAICRLGPINQISKEKEDAAEALRRSLLKLNYISTFKEEI